MLDQNPSMNSSQLKAVSNYAEQKVQPQQKQYVEYRDETPERQNPEMDIIPKSDSKKSLGSNSSKLLMKQKDRYEINPIEKGMFATIDESVDELKVIYTTADQSKEQQQTVVRKRKPMKLAPIQSLNANKSVKILDENDFIKKSNSIDKGGPKNKFIILPIKISQVRDINQFVQEALPKQKKLVAVLKRNRTLTKQFFSHYNLHFNEELKFIMSSWKNKWTLSSNFTLGTREQKVEEQDECYIGSLKANFVGSHFNLQDNKDNQIQVLATIIYISQLSCSDVPRKIQVYILSPFYRYENLAGLNPGEILDLKQLYDIPQNRQSKKIIKLVNKQPFWNAQKQAWCLDFQGRARYSSIKNMILVDAEDQKKQAMILGKAGADTYNLDAMFPLSPRVALAIASSCFDFKWASQ